jgi:hypothetical protein
MVFKKIDEEVGVDTGSFAFWWKALRGGGPYHDRRSRFR